MKRGTTRKTKNEHKIVLERKMVTLHQRIIWDLDLCVGCQIGAEICPHDAIHHVDHDLKNGRMVHRQGVDIEAEKCIYCGMCAVMCPMNAITMEVNGEESIPVQKYEAFPLLIGSNEFDKEAFDWRRKDFVIENCPTEAISYRAETHDLEIDQARCIRCRQCEIASDGAFHVVQPWEGGVTLRREKCEEGCLACADICPTRALYVDEEGELVLADYYCIKCGACAQICPIKGETEEYEVTYQSQGVTHTRVYERISNADDLPIWVELWRVKHTPVESAAWLAALTRVASDKAGQMEMERKRALRRRDLILALKGGHNYPE